MHRILFCIVLFSTFLAAVSAPASQFSSSSISRYVDRTPRDVENHSISLVKYLTKPFDNDYDKAKAIAFWIASRIHYDEYIYNNGKTTKLARKYDSQTPNELLKSRVGICGDFANLFVDLCRKAGIRATYISGYAYPAGVSLTSRRKHNAAHAWNSFVYKGKKIYVDTTFMAKGVTGVKKHISEMNHQRALRDIQRNNKNKSKVNEFDDFYFDFTYRKESQQRHYERKEK